MGAIPLLNREQEVALARRLEIRNRATATPPSPAGGRSPGRPGLRARTGGKCALDPTIDVVKTLHLSRDEILKRMPHNVKTLRTWSGPPTRTSAP